MNFSTNLVSFFRMIFQLSFAGQPPRAMRTGLVASRNFPDPPGIVIAMRISVYRTARNRRTQSLHLEGKVARGSRVG